MAVHLRVLCLWARRWYKLQSLLARCQYDARPAVTFLALGHHRLSTSAKLYYLVTEAGVRERLVQGRTRQRSGWGSNSRPLDHKSDVVQFSSKSSSWQIRVSCSVGERRAAVVRGIRRLRAHGDSVQSVTWSSADHSLWPEWTTGARHPSWTSRRPQHQLRRGGSREWLVARRHGR